MTRETDIQKMLDKLSERRQRPVICLITDIDEDSANDIRQIARRLENFKSNKLSVLIDSPGGYIEDAYRMVLALRQYADDIEVLVPSQAKSAATFFCISANTIYLGKAGELGPLDPQITDGSGSDTPKSALETFKALEQLLSHSLESLDGIIDYLLDITQDMDILHATTRAQPIFASIVSPLYQQIDPHELGEMIRYLSEGEEYAIRVMRRWSYPELSSRRRRRLVRRLIWDYPTHGFVIDLEEAKSIGLKAELLDEESDELCNQIIASSENQHIGIGMPQTQSIVNCLDCNKDVANKGDESNERKAQEGSPHTPTNTKR